MNKRYRGIVISLGIFIIMLLVVFVSNLGNSSSSKDINANLRLVNNISNQIRDLENNLFELKSNTYNESFDRGSLVNSWVKLQGDISDNINKKLENSSAVSSKNIKKIVLDWGIITGVFDNNKNSKDSNEEALSLRSIVSKVDRSDISLPQKREEALNLAIDALQSSEIIKHLDETLEELNGKLNTSFSISNGLQSLMIFVSIAFWIMFHRFYIRRLSEADSDTEEALAEIEDIMNTVNEGLFLLDDNLNLGHQYSRALENILRRENVAQINLRNLLERIISPSDFATVNAFIKQLFNPRVKQKLIHDLNPLDRIKVNLDRGGDVSTERWLSFHFNRVYKLGTREITKVLVSVSDITKAVHLEQRLKKEQEQSSQQVDLITIILSKDSRLIMSFVRSAAGAASRVNSILRRPHLRPSDLRLKVQDIFREIHSVKGEASAMEMHSFVNICTEIEDQLSRLRDKKNLSGDDFLSIAIELENLIHLTEQAEVLVKRLSNVKIDNLDELAQNIDNLNRSEAEILNHHFDQFASQVAQRQGKKVMVELLGFEHAHFDPPVQDGLRDIITQMVRNAIVHGIERPEERQLSGKPEVGNIMVELESSRNDYVLSVQDDGQGINLLRLWEKAQTLPQFQGRSLADVPEQELFSLIFISGFSTAFAETEDAGRGVGMDVIRQRVAELNGSISISSKVGEYTRFSVRFPKAPLGV